MGLPALLTEIGTISRFPTWGHFLVYAGIAPSGGTSGIAHLGDEKEQVVERDHPHRQCNKHIKTILVRAAKVICSLAKNTKSRDEIVIYARKILQQKLEKFPSFFKVATKLGRRIYYCLKKEVPYQRTSVEFNTQTKCTVATKTRNTDQSGFTPKIYRDLDEQSNVIS